MSQPQEVRVTANPNSSWLNKANQAIRGNNIVHSPDFLIEKSTRGTSLKLHPKHKYPVNGLQYASSSIDVSASYDAGTIGIVTSTAFGAVPGTYISKVNIPSLYYLDAMHAAGISTSGSDFSIYQRDPAINYIPNPSLVSSSAWQVFASGGGGSRFFFDESASYKTGDRVEVDFIYHTYSISYYDTGSGNMPPLCAGVFECVNDVPALISGSRPSGNIYYPFYPPWPDSAIVNDSGSIKNQIFWRPLLPLNVVSACINNETVRGFGLFYQTGSTYSFALPFP